MSTPLILSLLFFGLLTGIFSGVFGIGGGVILIMSFTALGLDQKTATGTSLAALIPPVGLLACLEYYQRGEVKISWAMIIAVGMSLGALLGAKLTAPWDANLLKKFFGVFLLLMGVKNLFF